MCVHYSSLLLYGIAALLVCVGQQRIFKKRVVVSSRAVGLAVVNFDANVFIEQPTILFQNTLAERRQYRRSKRVAIHNAEDWICSCSGISENLNTRSKNVATSNTRAARGARSTYFLTDGPHRLKNYSLPTEYNCCFITPYICRTPIRGHGNTLPVKPSFFLRF